MAKILIEAKPEDLADELAKALLHTVRAQGDHRDGDYVVKLRLFRDGQYRWSWAWYPPASEGSSVSPHG